jgi:hypothetical protein
VISITQSTQIEFSDWLGIIGTTRRRGHLLFTKFEQPTLEKTFFSTKLEQTRA